jgi:hypothetical protein
LAVTVPKTNGRWWPLPPPGGVDDEFLSPAVGGAPEPLGAGTIMILVAVNVLPDQVPWAAILSEVAMSDTEVVDSCVKVVVPDVSTVTVLLWGPLTVKSSPLTEATAPATPAGRVPAAGVVEPELPGVQEPEPAPGPPPKASPPKP